MERSWLPPFAKFCKNHLRLFLIAKHAEKIIMSRWKIPPQCPAFVMTTIREILQKSFPTFFKRQARWKKHYVTMENSTTMSSERKRCVMMANSRWPPFAKFCKNKGINKGSQKWRKMLTQNLGSQNLTGFIQNLTFNFVSLKIARGRKILWAFVNTLNEFRLFFKP